MYFKTAFSITSDKDFVKEMKNVNFLKSESSNFEDDLSNVKDFIEQTFH